MAGHARHRSFQAKFSDLQLQDPHLPQPILVPERRGKCRAFALGEALQTPCSRAVEDVSQLRSWCAGGPAPDRRRSRARGGFSLLEVSLSTVVLVIGLGAAVYALMAGMRLESLARERGAASLAALSVLEELQAEAFDEVYARFNATTADDPVGGASPGAGFAVRGLAALAGDPDGLPGEIVFPGDGVTLSELGVDAELGMPRDLDGDGDMDNAVGAYNVLPVLVRVRWRGPNGPQEVVVAGTLNNERKTP